MSMTPEATRAPQRLASSVGSAVATIRDARVVVGETGRSLDELIRVVDGSSERLTGELFLLTDEPVYGAMRRAARRDVSVSMLYDDEHVRLGWYAELGTPRPSIREVVHGTMPDKLHSKAVVADGREAWISTAAPATALRNDRALDISATFAGDAARSLEQLTLGATEAAAQGHTARATAAVRQAADAAAGHGILVNDPLNGVRTLRDRVRNMIDGATSSIYVGSKAIDDPKLIGRLVAAQQRGVQVLVETSHFTSNKQVQQLRGLGLDVSALPRTQGRMHANTVVVDTTDAYVGTAMLTRRGMGRSSAARRSREIGFVTGDPNAIRDILAGYATIPGSRLGTWNPVAQLLGVTR